MHTCPHLVIYTDKTTDDVRKLLNNLSANRWSRLPFMNRKQQSVASSQPCLMLKYTTVFPSPPLPRLLFLSIPSTCNMVGILHICKWITLFVGICMRVCMCVCVWVKIGKRVWEGKGAPAITLFFSSLCNPEEDKLWGTQRGSAIDLLGSSTSQRYIPTAQLSDTHNA